MKRTFGNAAPRCFQKKQVTVSAKNLATHQSGLSGESATNSEIIASQALYIDNLQQQVYFLENELGYLRSHMEQSNKLQPSTQLEAEKMVKKLSDNQKDIQTMKIELKRKQTTIDLLKSEKERLTKKMGEHEALAYQQKSSYLEEIVELKKIKDEYQEKWIDLERLFEEKGQHEKNLQTDYDSLFVQLEELKKEAEEDRTLIRNLQDSKQHLHQSLMEANMQLELKSAIVDQQEAMNLMKGEIQELHGKLAHLNSALEHERLLKSQLSSDNDNLIKRHAAIEAELAEAKAKLGEAKSIQSRLEDVHMKTVMETSEVKTSVEEIKSELENHKQRLKTAKEKLHLVASQLADEQRFRSREEQKVLHMEKRLEQKEEKVKAREKNNSELLKNNASLKDHILLLKNQLKNRDAEVETLKQKVLDMQVSVEEYVQNTQAASQLEGQRWRQLTSLAKGIQALSKDVVINPD